MSGDPRIVKLVEKSAREQSQIEAGLRYAQSYVVDSQEAYAHAFEIIRQARERAADLKTDLDEIRAPLKQVIDYVEASAVPKIAAFAEVERQLKLKATAWHNGEQERLRLTAQAAQAALQAAVAAPTPVNQALQRQTIEAVSTAHVAPVLGVYYTDVPTYEITNEELLEDQFVTVTPNKAACLAYARAHKGDEKASRPGLRIYTKQQQTVRNT